MTSKNLDLKEFGFKVTQPRVEILKLFGKNKDKHLSPDEVFLNLKHRVAQQELLQFIEYLTSLSQQG